MTKKELETALIGNLQELIETTQLKDEYEIEYMLEKARLYFSAEVSANNQVLRDAQVDDLLDQKGMYKKMVNLRTDAKIAWYKWSTIKSLIDGKVPDE